ncbi:serine hydroxymethyltransferase [uncultured Thalassospira sp.]|uniref:serine hydroxymethyltransferase n=1 Tax=uncultured Thalassospira sp. TaxID=404382 RepID=UPI00258A71AC|nr:serine hydroxymethyltransferase [uncultured Thalassospira sp.]
MKYNNTLERFAAFSQASLRQYDSELHGLLIQEHERQQNTLALVASCSIEAASASACEGLFLDNVTAEGYPSARYHAGCEVIDKIEDLAIQRAKDTFGAQYANIQPWSASIANQSVIASLLTPGDTVLGMDLDAGGHLSHGAKVNLSGKHYDARYYGVGRDGYLDFENIRQIALDCKPKLIIAGTTAYPRTIDFEKFRLIADEVGSFLLADITHIAGLVAAGLHPSPIDVAHVTTMCTHKQLFGPRGGLILSGKESKMTVGSSAVPLHQQLNRAVFPLFQGAPAPAKLAAKANALLYAGSREFRELSMDIKVLASEAAALFEQFGARVMFGGTDNHIVIVDVLTSFGITGIIAQKALEECGIIVNKNRIVNDSKPVRIASGIRIGTNSMAARKLSVDALNKIIQLILRVLQNVRSIDDTDYFLSPDIVSETNSAVRNLCQQFPIYK